MDKMYLFISSTDSQKTHPDNSPWDFTVTLPKQIKLSEQWEIGLLEIDYAESVTDKLVVFCDLCEHSYMRNGYLPLLRIVHAPMTFPDPYFMSISRDYIGEIRLYIRTTDLKTPSFDINTLNCTLLLRAK
jgi:hypothetical protein